MDLFGLEKRCFQPNSRLALALSLCLPLACGGAPGPPRSSGSAAPTTSDTIITPPASNARRYIIGGDSRDDRANVVAWAFRQSRVRGASAFIFLGDMELTPELDGHFSEELRILDPMPFFPVVGNHEVRMFGGLSFNSRHSKKRFRARFLDNARTPVKSSLPHAVVYSVDLPGGVHFIALDNVSQKGFGQEQLDWLEQDLTSARGSPVTTHVIVGMHKPLAKNPISIHCMSEDGDSAMKDSAAALEIMMRHRVSLIVASHLHQFARFMQGDIPSYITGGLGAPLTNAGPDHAFHHFLQVDVTDEALRVDVVRFPGLSVIGAGDDDDDDD